MTATSFGKVILSGEHSAFYGMPAVAASIELSLHAELVDMSSDKQPSKQSSPFIQHLLHLFQQKYQEDTTQLRIHCEGDLPVGSGLGSSAATAHAVLLALSQHFGVVFSDDEKIAFIQEAES